MRNFPRIGFPGPKTAPVGPGNKGKKKKNFSKRKARRNDPASNKSDEEKEDHRTPLQIEEDHILERFSSARRRKGM